MNLQAYTAFSYCLFQLGELKIMTSPWCTRPRVFSRAYACSSTVEYIEEGTRRFVKYTLAEAISPKFDILYRDYSAFHVRNWENGINVNFPVLNHAL